MKRLGIIGDDLTGLAAMVAEAAFGGRSAAITDLDSPAPDCDIWGIDINTREMDAASNYERATAAIQLLQNWGCEDILIKADSLWRGHPESLLKAAKKFGEVAVFNDHFEASSALEVQYFGGLNATRHLEIISHARQAGIRLWIGGLSLARVVTWISLPQKNAVLAVVGSCEMISEQQIAFCKANGVPVLEGSEPDVAKVIADHFRQGQSCILTQNSASITALDKHAAEQQFASWSEIIQQIPKQDYIGLILTGGHTASSVLSHMGATTLRLTPYEAATGLPICTVNDGKIAGAALLTKPGHFGAVETLLEAIMALQLVKSIERA